MNQEKTGEIIRFFRTKSNLTQNQLAERISVSNKTVSKWECGKGCPDISLLTRLAVIFGTDVDTLLSEKIEKNESEKGNMKKLRFYVCKECGNIITSTSDAVINCCGNRLEALTPQKADENQQLSITDIGGEWFISSDHEMTKEHYISFAAYISDSTVMMFRQYPEWNLQITLPMFRTGRIMWYCTKCGLFYQNIHK